MRKSALLASLAALGAAPTAFAGTLNVPSQYPTIQAAINAATTGDVVLVAVGTFKENIDLKGKAITVQGKDRKKTLIDGSNGGPCITMASGETAATVITNLTVKFGTGKLIGSKRYGGGVYIAGGSDPSLISMSVGFNSADFGAGVFDDVGSDGLFQDVLVANNVTNNQGTGGGMYVAGNPTIVDSRIAENTATNGTGGGVYLVNSTATIDASEIDTNFSYYGAGVHVNGGTPSITNNVFETNSVLAAPIDGEGAGLAVVGKATPWVSGNEFRLNTAHSGAGIYVYDASPSVVSNLIHDNSANTNKTGGFGYGGGLSYGKGGGSVELNQIYANTATLGGGMSTRSSTTTTLLSNVIDTNTTGGGVGGGLYSKDSTPFVLANTIVLNTAGNGGGVYAIGKTAPSIDTSIIYFNVAGANPSFYDGTGVMVFGFSDIEASSVGGSSLSIDPLFVNAASRDYRLSSVSPVVDAGNFTFSGSGNDVYGNVRVNGGRIDMGAAEQ